MSRRDAIGGGMLALVGVLSAGSVAADTGVAGMPSPADSWTPVPWLGSGERDPAGLSPYRRPTSRSPTGTLYDLPPLPRPASREVAGWQFSGFGEAGLRAVGGASRNAVFGQYRDLSDGPVLTRFDLGAVKPDAARYVQLVGSGIGQQDPFVGLQIGRYNDHRLSLSFGEQVHRGSTTARLMWQGVGTGTLTLLPAPGVAAGGASTSNAANAAALQALLRQTGDSEIGVRRRSGAVRFETRLAEGWTFTSSYTLEGRQGTRAFGANEGNGDTVEPIDQRTHELRAGVQFADATTQFNAAVAASLFRNAIDTLSWENPFQHPVGPLRILGGRADLAPDNEAYHARVDLARALSGPWRARLTATVELGVQRQNDRLIAPTSTSGVGVPFGNGFDGNFDRWNSTAALSQERAHVRIDTRLVDLGLSLAPAGGVTLRTTLRHHETRNRTAYTAFNPLTGQYGYIIQDTNPRTVYDGSNNVHIRSIPFEGAQDQLRVGGEWQPRRRAVLSAEIEREEWRRAHRERHHTWEDRVRLAYTDRGFEQATLRLKVEQASRRGSAYVSNPYREFYTEVLPDYTDSRANLLERLHNLEELRKFDLADRRQQLLEARLNLLPRDDLDLGLTLQARSNDYPALFGRVGAQEQASLHLDVGFLPSTRTAINAYASWQGSRMRQAGAADLGSAFAAGCLVLPPSCSNSFGAPGSIYPAELAWSAVARERSHALGVGLRHDFGRPQLDVQLTQLSSRSPLGYEFASALALQSPTLAALAAAEGFVDMRYRLRSIETALRLPLATRTAVRLMHRHEAVRIGDWHYSGLDTGTVVGTRVYLDAGPSGYRVDVFGVFLQLLL